MFNLKPYISQSGQIFVLSIIVLAVILIGTLVLVSNSFVYKQNSRYTLDKLDATNLAEAGIDRAIAVLNETGGNYNGETGTSLGSGSYSVTVTNIDQNTKLVESTGYVPNKTNPKSTSKISIRIQKGEGISFSYGIQAGEGGFVMSGGSRVNGSVFSNGNIFLSGGALITGTAQVAGGTQPTSNQETDCSISNCEEYEFGKTISGQNRFDIAQSFRPNQTQIINKVALKIKKIGNPPNVTVRIMGDSSGKPNKSNVLATGTLASNLVSALNPGFVEVGFINGATLQSETTCWIMIDTSSNNTNYWVWQKDNLGSYTRGSASWSPNWDAGNPAWTAISGDLSFKVYMGGLITKIAGSGSSIIQGSAYANTLTADNSSALQINGEAYYQTQSGITVQGQNCNNNTHCHPSSPDLQPLTYPISQSNIDDWKDMADDAVYNGNLNIQWPCTTTLEKRKYVGDVTVGGGCNIQIDTPVWITGNFTMSSGATVRLNSSYGPSSGVIIVGGITALAGGSTLKGSGTAGSYMTVVSENSSDVPPAIAISGGNSSSILFAPNGTIELTGGSNLREATANKIRMSGGAILTYETGVTNPFYPSGPTGSYSAVKGTYQIK